MTFGGIFFDHVANNGRKQFDPLYFSESTSPADEQAIRAGVADIPQLSEPVDQTHNTWRIYTYLSGGFEIRRQSWEKGVDKATVADVVAYLRNEYRR